MASIFTTWPWHPTWMSPNNFLWQSKGHSHVSQPCLPCPYQTLSLHQRKSYRRFSLTSLPANYFAKGLFFHYLFQTWRSFSINARGVCDKNHVLTTTTNQAKNHVMIINLSKKTLLNAQHWFMGSKQIYHHWLHNSISYFMFFMSTHIYRLYLAKWAKNWTVNCT